MLADHLLSGADQNEPVRRVAVSCLVLFVGLIASGCQTVEESEVWDITLRNDTSRVVVVKDCRTSACDRIRYTSRLPPGASTAAKDYGDHTSWWRVYGKSETLIGCLTLDSHNRLEGYVLRVSSLTNCSSG